MAARPDERERATGVSIIDVFVAEPGDRLAIGREVACAMNRLPRAEWTNPATANPSSRIGDHATTRGAASGSSVDGVAGRTGVRQENGSARRHGTDGGERRSHTGGGRTVAPAAGYEIRGSFPNPGHSVEDSRRHSGTGQHRDGCCPG